MEIKVGKNRIELYDSAENLNIVRYQKLNKYLMLSNEVGSNFDDYDHRLKKTLQYLNNDMTDKAKNEIQNSRQALFNIKQEFSPQLKALAILVKRINNKTYDSMDPTILKEVEDSIKKMVTYKKMTEALEFVKKK